MTITQDRAEVTIIDNDGRLWLNMLTCILQNNVFLVIQYIVEAATISLSPTSYVVDESEGVVNIIVTKTGLFSRLIQGKLTTLVTDSASGEIFEHIFLSQTQQVVTFYLHLHHIWIYNHFEIA